MPLHTTDTNVTLYHFPLSFYSQIVRLVLEEKDIPYAGIVIDIGPRLENYEPWYVRLNSRGVVPTLKHGDHIVTDAFQIIRYLDSTFAPLDALTPSDADERAAMETWLEKLDAFPMREFSYGNVRGPMRCPDSKIFFRPTSDADAPTRHASRSCQAVLSPTGRHRRMGSVDYGSGLSDAVERTSGHTPVRTR
ncbi:glutathione S-transferase family protein [Candidatus Uhrbacteria bacterium]|nr:glutathione S-transferase family protein [Candidatus Uhrbacteria bacterium]